MTSLPEPLDQLDEGERALLEHLLEPVHFPAGTRIFEEGSPGDDCLLLDEGRVRIQLEREHVDGEAVLSHLSAGSILGELSLLDQRPRSASAYAETEVHARRITAVALEAQRQSNPGLYGSVMAILGRAAAGKLREANEMLADAVFPGSDAGIDATVERARAAQRAFVDWPEARLDALLLDMAESVAARAEPFARLTVERTRIGNVADKIVKNRMASIGIYRSLEGLPGDGPLSHDEARKVTELASPAGIVFGLIPVTNPVATAIFKSLIALKARNALILSFHRTTNEIGEGFVELIQEVLERHGAPADLIQMVRQRSSRKTTIMYMRHPGVSLILATGGSSMVKAAYSSGTPAIGVGPGNAPTLISRDAELDHAATCIVESKSFDNGLICGSEHSLVVVAEIADAFRAALARHGAAVLTSAEAEEFVPAATDPRTRHIRRRMIGRAADEIARYAGIQRDHPIRLIVVPTGNVAPEDAMSREKIAPVLSLYTVADEEEGIRVCRELLEIEGTGHTAIIHTRDADLVRRFAAAVPASRILVNSPGSQGVIGHTTGLVPSLTLGCGTFGGNSTSDNVSFRHLLNVKRVAEFMPPVLDLSADLAAGGETGVSVR